MVKKLKKLLHLNSDMFVGTIDSLAYKILDSENLLIDKMYHVREFIYMFIAYLKDEKSRKITDKIKYIFIDEFQDINKEQYEFINLLYQRGIIVTVVGDDYQNIYTFRDSTIEYIINFEKYFSNSQTYCLEVNYRSVPEIVNIANKVIKNNMIQKSKNMIPYIQISNIKPKIINIPQWQKQYDFIIDNIKKNPMYNIAILGRNNGILYDAETYLTLFGIKCKLIDNEEKPKEDKNCVTICTIHKSKGLEWDMVFNLGLNDKYFASDFDKIEEDRRLFYVAITRAKKKLFLMTCGNPTRFLKELAEDDIDMYGITYRDIIGSKIINSTIEKKNKFSLDSCPIEQFYRIKKLLLQVNIESKLLWDKKEIPPFIKNNDLIKYFYSFITLCIKRMLTCKFKLDEFTQKLIYSVYVPKREIKSINVTNLQEKTNYSFDKISQLENKIYTYSYILKVKPEEIIISDERNIKLYNIYIPYIRKSFLELINENNSWDKICPEIYITSLLKYIKFNRIKSLFSNLDCSWINDIKSWLFEIEGLFKDVKIKSNSLLEDYFIDNNNKLWIIKNSELKLEWLIEIVMLGYDNANIFDPINGLFYTITGLPQIDLLNEIEMN
jgi:hypothetical protein